MNDETEIPNQKHVLTEQVVVQIYSDTLLI